MTALAVAALLAATMFTAHQIGARWPRVINDRYIYAVALLSASLAMWRVEHGLGLLLLMAVIRWRCLEDVIPVLLLGTATGVYAVVRYGGPDVHAAAQAMIVATAMVQSVWGAWELLWRGVYRNHLTLQQARNHPRGSMGNRIYIGGLAAIAAPLAPLWALPVLLVGLVVTNTYLALAAGALGLWVTYPYIGPWLGVVALLGIWPLYWWRGNPVDSLRGRLEVWRLCAAVMWHTSWQEKLVGCGPGSFPAVARWWVARKWTGQAYIQAHSDLVQVVFEYGLIGLLAVALWLARVGQYAQWGDPLTGAFVAMLVMAVAAFPSYLPAMAVPMLCVAAMLGAR